MMYAEALPLRTAAHALTATQWHLNFQTAKLTVLRFPPDVQQHLSAHPEADSSQINPDFLKTTLKLT
ncbi:MAG: hypothetical protein Q8Q54_01360 [Methylococcales bacterium]|nr:hypothetical protein [Methylococcales bacterium]MDP3007667.1 hypothetical protein [Methylococcales bacterium]MDP3837548.1 hypothetical protein [Methylococcales bacterium]